MVVQPTLIENLLIVIGEGAWVFSGVAQLIRLVRTRNTRGLSAPSQTLNAAGNVGWFTYFALNHLWFPFVTNILLLLITVAILGYTLSNRKQFTKGLLTIAIVGPLTSYVLLHFPQESGWLAMLYNQLAGMPQLIRIIRRKKVSGISEHGLYFAFGAMLFTLAYALLIHALPLITGCTLGLLTSVIIFRYYYRYRRHG